MHCPGHQRGDAQITQVNRAADKVAKLADQDFPILGAIMPHINL